MKANMDTGEKGIKIVAGILIGVLSLTEQTKGITAIILGIVIFVFTLQV